MRLPALLLREARLAGRSPQEALLPLAFFVLAATLFPLGIGPEPERLREIAPGVRVASGYSGQGVMLAPYVGKLLAEGNAQTLALMARVPTPPFPGGRWLRWPLTVAGLSWYALRDRL